jgi:hypothetical protein
MKGLGIIGVVSVVKVYNGPQFLNSSDTREKWEYNGMVYHLLIDFKKAYDLDKREAL